MTTEKELGAEIEECLKHRAAPRVNISRQNLDRAIRYMPEVEAVLLLRAAYLCSEKTAQYLYDLIVKEIARRANPR